MSAQRDRVNGGGRGWALFFAAALAVLPGMAQAMDPPHDDTRLTNGCQDCHQIHGAPGPVLTNQSNNQTLCTSCHATKTDPAVLNWQPTQQASPGSATGTSHSWTGAAVSPTVGATLPTDANLLAGLAGGTNLQCSTCHDQHSQGNAPFDPTAPATAGQAGRHFLKLANNSGQMCADCHASWVQSAVTPTYFSGASATFTSGSTAVTGTGTTWTAQLAPGDRIKRTTDTAAAWGVIKTVNSNTSLTLAAGYTGATGAAVGWQGAKTLSHPVGVPLPAASALTRSVPYETGGAAAQVAGFWGTSTSGSTLTLVDGTKNFTGAVGWVVRFTSGANRGTTKTITSVTGGNTTINWTGALASAITAGVTYEIDRDGNFSNNLHLSNGSAVSFTTGNVVCMSCHEVHFGDSTATTYDDRPPAGTGDGNLLRRGSGETCDGCHPSAAVHSSATTSTKHGTWGTTFTCSTCHDPHQTGNAHLVTSSMVTPNLGTIPVQFQVPAAGQAAYGQVDTTGQVGNQTSGRGPCEACHTDTRTGTEYTTGTVNIAANGLTVTCATTCGWPAGANALVGYEFRVPAQGAAVWTRISASTATTLTLTPAYLGTRANGLAYAVANPRYRGLSAGRNNLGSGAGALGTEHYAGDCLACHSHEKGFLASESVGAVSCEGCHSGIYTQMTTGGTHYHKMVSAAATYATGAPTSGLDARRTCLMCHADHDLFSPVNNPTTGGRGKNLRVEIGTAPTTVNGLFTNKDFDAAATNGGICVSCHAAALTRGYTDATAGTVTAVVTKADFSASAHTFSGAATTSNFPGTLTNTFVGDCGKCHDDTTTKSIQTSGYKQATHNSTLRGMAATLDITAPADPLAEKLCYRCHSLTTDTTPGGGPAKLTANKDYFGLANMTTQSERIFQVVTNATTYPFGHPIGTTSAAHKASDGEGAAANDGSLSGTNRHATCADCHNPHAAKKMVAAQAGTATYAAGTAPNFDTLTDATKAWTANQWKGYTVKIVSATAGAGQTSAIYGNTGTALSVELGTAPTGTISYIIVGDGRSDGNLLGAAEAASWGLNPTFPTQPTPPPWDDVATGAPTDAADATNQYATILTWNRVATPTMQGQVCIKCHSAYAYGTTPPSTPSGLGNSLVQTWTNTPGGTMPQSDLANQFNPNNLSHHAVFARGRNQPVRANYGQTGIAAVVNTNWPKYSTANAGDTLTVSNGTATLAGTAALPGTALPGWFIYAGSDTLPVTTGSNGTATTGFLEITAIASPTSFSVRAENGAGGYTTAITFAATANWAATAGLGNNFVPPWGPWSTLQCTDCHSSDVTTDPFGPHGSGTKWSLRKFAPQNFMLWNGTAVAAVANSTGDTYNMCLNCHRRDVYGDLYAAKGSVVIPTNANWSRQSHPIDSGDKSSLAIRSNWGIVCMNCHGGARSGTIHGTNLGVGATLGGSYSGTRLLAGASWYAVTRGTTATAGQCWTKGATDSVDNCGHRHTGVAFQSGVANYNYDAP